MSNITAARLAEKYGLRPFPILVEPPSGKISDKPTVLTGYHSPDVDPAWQDGIVTSLRDCLPRSLLYILAHSQKQIIAINSPDEFGRGSHVSNPNDFFKRSPAEMEAVYFYDPLASIMLAQTSFNRIQGKYTVKKDVPQLTIHEAMHALDDSFLAISTQPGLMAAYQLDAMLLRVNGRVTGAGKASFGYQLQPGLRGRAEALAEIGAQLFTGKCRAGDMEKNWKHSYCWVKAYFEFVERNFDERKYASFEDGFSYLCGMAAERTMIREHVGLNHDFALMTERLMQGKPVGLDCRGRSAREKKRLDIFADIIDRQGKKGMGKVLEMATLTRSKNAVSGAIEILIPGSQPGGGL